MQRPVAMIAGLGAAVPSTVITNADLEARLDTSDQWIVDRTGIRERRMLQPGQALSDLFVTASRDALAKAGLEFPAIQAVVCGTCTPDRRLPSTLLQFQVVPGGDNRLCVPGGMQAVDSGYYAIGKIPRRRHVGKSLQLGRNGDEFFVEIVLYHGFLT